MLCKKTYKNQITLPKKILKQFEDVEYFEVDIEDNKIILKPVKISSFTSPSISRIREKIASLDLTEKDIEEAIKCARKK